MKSICSLGNNLKTFIVAGQQWLTPVILAIQEDHDLKPSWANSSSDPISKNPSQENRAGEVTQGEGPEFKSHYCKK
jgi:hypothetical protein